MGLEEIIAGRPRNFYLIKVDAVDIAIILVHRNGIAVRHPMVTQTERELGL